MEKPGFEGGSRRAYPHSTSRLADDLTGGSRSAGAAVGALQQIDVMWWPAPAAVGAIRSSEAIARDQAAAEAEVAVELGAGMGPAFRSRRLRAAARLTGQSCAVQNFSSPP